MGGLYKLFLKILPIITLICFICFGITHTFDANETRNLTYLGHENVQYVIYTRDPNTQEIIQETKTQKVYTFDMTSYANNLDIGILRRATTNSIDLDKYDQTLHYFSAIWEDGWQIGDIIKTIANAIILVINTIILPINVLLIPLRVIAGVILTGLSIVGINITRNGTIIATLTYILDRLAIRMISLSFQGSTPEDLTDTYWQFYSANELQQLKWNTSNSEKLYINFGSHGYNYIGFQIIAGNNPSIKYFWKDANNQEQNTFVYTNGQWIDEQYRTIQIGQAGSLTQDEADIIVAYLIYYGQQI